MGSSKVYFTNMRTVFDTSLLDKLRKLIFAAGIDTIDFNDKYTAIKIHFGEPGNLAFLRPNYAKVVVDAVRSLGGKPFLTDCNTLYVGGRKNALDHLESAYENGFSPFSTGCHILIADGLKGTDEVEVPVVGGTYVNKAKIGRAVMDADIVISLNHFKAHEATGIGGALKNLGMGCGSFAGKKEMHEEGKPFVNKEECIGCGACIKNCAHGAISFDQNGKAGTDHSKCAGCARCIGVCPVKAISGEDKGFDMLNMKISEYAQAVINGRPAFHISLIMDVSPYCDCHAENDMALIPDIGMLASFDPVALDMACADLCNAQKPIPGSAIDGRDLSHGIFAAMHPETDYISGIRHAEALGLGSMEYELIDLDK